MEETLAALEGFEIPATQKSSEQDEPDELLKSALKTSPGPCAEKRWPRASRLRS